MWLTELDTESFAVLARCGLFKYILVLNEFIGKRATQKGLTRFTIYRTVGNTTDNM